MRWLVGCLVACLLAGALSAQERAVTVQLDTGDVLHGTVVEPMSLALLQVRVGDTVHSVPADRIRHCRFGPAPVGEPEPAAAEPRPVEPAAPTTPIVEREVPASTGDEVATVEEVEVSSRRASLLHGRLERFERAHPWLQPSRPTQWISYVLVLAILATLGIHFAVRVAGGEAVTLARSFGLCAWYMLSALAQLAMVPGNSLALVAMLLANPAFALFWLTNLFGLPRLHATVAFAIQLGLLALGYGVVEFVTAVLAATTHPAG